MTGTRAPRLPDYDVVIPCHDRADVVGEAVDSVLRQSHAPSRVILVDDGSSDATAAVVRDLEARHPPVRALVMPRNGGVGHARNAGIAACVSQWIAFLDDDDMWVPGAAAALLGGSAAREADVVVGAFARAFSDGGVGPSQCGWDGGDIRAGLRTGGVVGTSWSIVRCDAVYAVGGFDPSFRTCEDWDFFTRVAATGRRFVRIDKLVALYRTVAGPRMIEDAALSADEARVRAHPYLAADADFTSL